MIAVVLQRLLQGYPPNRLLPWEINGVGNYYVSNDRGNWVINAVNYFRSRSFNLLFFKAY